MNKQIKIGWLVIQLFFLAAGCSKGGGEDPEPQPPAEENLRIAVDPDPGTVTVPALGSSYSFKLQVLSKMPLQGVKTEVSCTRDTDNGSVFSRSFTGSTSPADIVILDLPAGVLCTVRVSVSSVSKPSNAAAISFKLARK